MGAGNYHNAKEHICMVPKRGSQLLSKVIAEGRKNLLETEAKALCREYRIPVTNFELAKNEDEAVRFAKRIGFPIVLKIVSPDILHKSDVGGVMLDVKDADGVRRAYEEIMKNVRKHASKAKIVGVLVQEMVPPSTEVIVGSIKDPQFGPALMFGLGGIFVEVLKDVTFRIAPIKEDEAREMISEVRAYPLLKGYRNTPPADLDAIVGILVNASKIVTEHEEIKEMDLNPVIVYERGAKTVDARVILE